MNEEQRLKASIDQIEKFFQTYYFGWRLAKILINEKVLKTRKEFMSDFAEELIQREDQKPETVIAHEVANGLCFDILSSSIQYIEDLFALLKAGKKKEFFIKELITYSAGTVENLIKEKTTKEELCKLFYFPIITEFDNEDVKKAMESGISQLMIRIKYIKEFYKTFQFHYNQYKHGLTIALKPYGDINVNQIDTMYDGELNPFMVAIDNLSVNKVKTNKYRYQNYMMIPCLTKNTQPFLNQLDREDNLLRFVMCPPETSIKNFKKCAYMVRDCLYIFTNNFLSCMRGGDILSLQMPTESRDVYSFDFPVDEK